MRITRKYAGSFGRAGIAAIVVAAVFAGGLGLGTGLSSTGAQAGGQINACVNNFTGQLRITSSSGQCMPSERALNWNQQGPGGLLDIEVVSDSVTIETEDERDSVFVAVQCPVGYHVVGGGAGRTFSAGSPIVSWFMDASAPGIKGDSPAFPDSDGWSATFETLDGEDAVGQYGFFADAICVLTS